MLRGNGGAADAEKARESRNLRRGKGKMRNRRYVTRKGPLVVYGEDSGLVRAFRNIPGVDTQSVESLNLLQVPAQAVPSYPCNALHAGAAAPWPHHSSTSPEGH